MRTDQSHIQTHPVAGRLPLLLLTLTACAGLPVALSAQAAVNSSPSTTPVVKKHTAHAHAHKPAKPAAQAIAAAKPTAPEVLEPPKPDWPVNDKPAPAAITWNASGLRIEASNSSLAQILKEVCTLTGATMDGLGADERVFGIYGPGPAREVLARLFYGSGYNLLLIGDRGEGTPRQILLTSRDGKTAAKAPNGGGQDDDADEVEQDDQQPEQQPPPSPMHPNTPPQPGTNGRPPTRPPGAPDAQLPIQQQQ